ncbi:MAG: nitrous oxide reductase family maturation protein NosD, partial [Bacteroidetes bacterium]
MKNLKYILILALLTAWLSPNAARAATWRVCADCPVSSLRAAIRQAAPCDTIVVDGGVWADTTIVIDKSIVLLGVNDPVIDGQGGKHELMLIAAHQVEVAGFTFRNMGVNFLEDVAALRAESVREVHIHHNRFENTFFAIYLAHVRGGEIANNVIRGQAVEENNSGNAIHAWYCSDLRIHDNDVAGHRDGIYFEFVDHSRIADNHSHDNLRYGLHFMFSDDDVYYRNTFERNGAGVAVMFSRRIDMWHNVFRHNWGGASFGLLLKEIYDAEIRDNQFEKNTIGIFVEGSNRITYTRNRFERNGWAVKMNGGCLDNAFTHNA